MTLSRAINSTGKINQNIRSSGLAGSGWQETSQVGLFNGYQNALNTNSSDYNTAVKELNIAISQAKTSGDIATMQAIQTYAIQLAQQLYQEARDAVADAQWERSFALQKAAFDLEHAAQTGSNSNYYGSNSYSYPANTKTVIDDSARADKYSYYQSIAGSYYIDPTYVSDVPATVDFEIQNAIFNGEDPKEAAKIYIMVNAEGLGSYVDYFMDKYGLTEEDF